MQLVLASKSRYKREALQRLGIPFEWEDPAIDESPKADETPEELVLRLSAEKARAVAARRPGCIVVAADQVAEVDGVVLTKPKTAERACAQLAQLSGRTHRLLTGLAVSDGVRMERRLEVHVMTMRKLTEAAIERYVRRDSPLDCSGAYKIEAAGIALFSSILGADPQAIVGLPLIALVNLLQRFGVEIP